VGRGQDVDWRRESGQPPHIVCWFNAWAHDDAAHLGAALAADVARTVDRERRWWRRLLSPLPSSMLSARERWRRRVTLAVATLVPALAVAFAPGLRDLLGGASSEASLDRAFGARLGSVAVAILAGAFVWRRAFAATETAARFIDDPSSEAARGSMQEVKGELGRLIDQARRGRRKPSHERRKVVVFVDDLERCRPPRALEVCEIACNLLAQDGLVTILIADMGVIAASAGMKYAQLESSEADGRMPPGEYGRLYLQKIVQIQFDLPPARGERVLAMLNEEADEDRELRWTPIAVEPTRWARRGEILERIGVGSILATTLATGVFFAIRPYEGADDRATAFFTGAFAAIFAWALIGFVVKGLIALVRRAVTSLLAGLARRRLKKLDDKLALLALENGDPTEVVAEAEAEHGPDSPEAEFARRRVIRYFADESSLRVEAENQIQRFLPLVPRGAKRMLNHLRLRLYVAIERGMLGDGFSPAHIGKWVVLEERWPELARIVKQRPAALVELERAADREDIPAELAGLSRNGSAPGELADFVRTTPRLGAFAQQLVFLEPGAARAGD
jgi:hypothetical protein